MAPPGSVLAPVRPPLELLDTVDAKKQNTKTLRAARTPPVADAVVAAASVVGGARKSTANQGACEIHWQAKCYGSGLV